jgi:hypothetical protein
MKETCEKLFAKGKIGYTVLAILIIIISIAVPIIVIAVGAKLKISVIIELAFADILAVVACVFYKKSAYYFEMKEDNLLFYTDKGVIEKSVSDCKRMIKTASELFMFFGDGMIRLCSFRKCREVTQRIKKENFPNIK